MFIDNIVIKNLRKVFYQNVIIIKRSIKKSLKTDQNIQLKPRTMSQYTDIVYKSIDSVLEVFKKPENINLDQVRRLVSTYEKACYEETLKHKTNKLHSLIVLEGLDGCGKSTMTKRLSKTLNAELYGTPPKCLAPLRPIFDGMAYKKLRPLFYSLGNYIAALEMKTILQDRPVVLDRFWHSTSSYAIVQAIEDFPDRFKLPPEKDEIYIWPKDLLKPNIVLFLKVSEEIRKTRLRRREELTMQENLLAAKQLFRENVLELYRRMEDPEVIFVNGESSKLKTERELLKHIQKIPEFSENTQIQIKIKEM